MVEAKYLCFPIFLCLYYSPIIHQHGFKNIPTANMLNSGKKQRVIYIVEFSFHPFFKRPAADEYLTWPLSGVIVGMNRNLEVT